MAWLTLLWLLANSIPNKNTLSTVNVYFIREVAAANGATISDFMNPSGLEPDIKYKGKYAKF
jgi:hypothetical protein